MITIFDYLDYREYLNAYYKEKKALNPFFSYRYLGRRVGMDSSFVIKVLHGQLHISRKKIESFIKVLDLKDPEAGYFETLVHFCRAKSERERKIYFEKLFSTSTIKAQCLSTLQYEFFQKWYYSAVWSIISFCPFTGNYEALAEQCMPGILVSEAKNAVVLLEKLGLIAKTDNEYRTTTLNITTGQKWLSHAVEMHQTEMIRLAGESIERFKKSERDISTVTLSMSEDDLPEIQDLIRQFRTSLIKLVNSSEKSNRVFQLNVQLFPLSTGGKKI